MRSATVALLTLALLFTSALARPIDNGDSSLRKLRGANVGSSQGQDITVRDQNGQLAKEQAQSNDLGVGSAVSGLTGGLTGIQGVTGVNGVGGALPDVSGLLGALLKLAGGQTTTGTEQSSGLGLGGLTAVTKAADDSSASSASTAASTNQANDLLGGLTGGAGGLGGLTGGLTGGASNSDIVAQLLETLTGLVGSGTGGLTGGTGGGDLLGGVTGGLTGGSGGGLGGLTGGLGDVFGRKLQQTITSSEGQDITVRDEKGTPAKAQTESNDFGTSAAISELTGGLTGIQGVTGVNGIGGSLPDVSGLLGGAINVLGGKSNTGTEQSGDFGLSGLSKTLGVVG